MRTTAVLAVMGFAFSSLHAQHAPAPSDKKTEYSPYLMVITDHAENLGLAPLAREGDPDILATEFGKKVHELLKAGKGNEAFDAWRFSKAQGKDPWPVKTRPLSRFGKKSPRLPRSSTTPAASP